LFAIELEIPSGTSLDFSKTVEGVLPRQTKQFEQPLQQNCWQFSLLHIIANVYLLKVLDP
jgi:hypothetical protein